MTDRPIIKSKGEIALMRSNGHVLSRIMREVSEAVRPGVTTGELDKVARGAMRRFDATSSFLGYAPWGKTPYPAVICISVDAEVVHGIPGPRVLREGEIVSLDCGIKMNGFHADMAVTLPVGKISREKQALMDACRSALWAGLREVRPGAMLSDVGRAIQGASKPYGVVAGYGGHGIGASLHEAPFVPNRIDQTFGDIQLCEGMVLAIEPMLNLGKAAIYEADDGWTVMTSDGSPSAHFEHTVAIVNGRFEVLTLDDVE